MFRLFSKIPHFHRFSHFLGFSKSFFGFSTFYTVKYRKSHERDSKTEPKDRREDVESCLGRREGNLQQRSDFREMSSLKRFRDKKNMRCRRVDVFSRRLDVFGRRLDVFGRRLDVLGRRLDVFGRRMDVFGRRMDVFGRRMDVFVGGWVCLVGGWMCSVGGWMCLVGGWMCL